MEKVPMKYLGKNPTLARLERSGEKVEVKEGGVVDVEKALAIQYAKTYKNVWVPANGLKKSEPKVEGALDEDKVEKAVPKKSKK